MSRPSSSSNTSTNNSSYSAHQGKLLSSSPSSLPPLNKTGANINNENTCICATCYTAQPLPRPSSSISSTFHCAQCRMSGHDSKILMTRRAFPAEHSTR